MFSITGMASGLDTDNMLQQLLQVERQPIRRLEQRQSILRKEQDAWGEVTKRLSSLRTSIDSLSDTSLAEMWKAASSNEAVATASVTGTPSPGSTSFEVTSLATAKTSHSQTGLASADLLVGTGEMTVEVDGATTTITTTATTTLSDLAAQIDEITGVGASVVKAETGDHRLVLTAEETGTANAYTTTVTNGLTAWGGFAETAAKDATLDVGGLTVTRSTNTITDLVEGVSLTLKDTGSVTVDTSQDLDGAVGAVKGLVDEVNRTLDKLKGLSDYNPESNTGGPLQGDSTVRRLVDTLRRGVMDVVGGISGTYTTAGSVGISMNDDGGFTLDETKLKAALETDPTAVDDLLGRGATSTLGGVSYVSSTSATQVGEHEAYVHQAAAVATLTGAVLTSPPPPEAQYTITGKDGKTVSVSVSGAASIAEAVAQINQQISAATDAPDVTAREEGGAIVLEGSRYGSAHGFDVTSTNDNYGLVGSVTGTDAQVELYGDGTGNGSGTLFTGSGDTVRVTSGGAEGLVLSVGPDAQVATAGSVTVSEGVVGRLDRLLSGYEGTTGFVDRAQKSLDGQVDLYQDRIEAFERRVASREETLRRQFTAMETAMAELQSQGNWLAGQLGGLSQPPQ